MVQHIEEMIPLWITVINDPIFDTYIFHYYKLLISFSV